MHIVYMYIYGMTVMLGPRNMPAGFINRSTFLFQLFTFTKSKGILMLIDIWFLLMTTPYQFLIDSQKLPLNKSPLHNSISITDFENYVNFYCALSFSILYRLQSFNMFRAKSKIDFLLLVFKSIKSLYLIAPNE